MANFFSARLFSKLRAFCIQWIRPIMPRGGSLHVSPAARIGKQPNLLTAVTLKAVGISTHISSKLEHLSKVFIPTDQLENERCARRQFPSILSQTPTRLLGIAKHLSLWTWGLPPSRHNKPEKFPNGN